MKFIGLYQVVLSFVDKSYAADAWAWVILQTFHSAGHSSSEYHFSPADITPAKFESAVKVVSCKRPQNVNSSRAIAKRASDVITQTNSDKQNGMLEDLKLFSSAKESVPKTIFKKNCHSFISYYSQSMLMLSDSRGVRKICILFFRLRTLRYYLYEVNSKFQNNRYYGCTGSCRSITLRFLSYDLMKQLRSCKNQWGCWKKNLKDLKDKVCDL